MKNETCCECGIAFGMPDSVMAERRKDGKYFFCPNGHQMHYTDTDIMKLRREIEMLKERNKYLTTNRDLWKDDAQSLGRSLSATKGVVTKLKKLTRRSNE